LIKGIKKNIKAVTRRESTIDFLYPKTPERSPEKNIDIP
jgi:hypothetical protein